jgi:hypothetical protein
VAADPETLRTLNDDFSGVKYDGTDCRGGYPLHTARGQVETAQCKGSLILSTEN